MGKLGKRVRLKRAKKPHEAAVPEGDVTQAYVVGGIDINQVVEGSKLVGYFPDDSLDEI